MLAVQLGAFPNRINATGVVITMQQALPLAVLLAAIKPVLAAALGASKQSFGVDWWPQQWAQAEERAFEIAVGAVLTQNTRWENVQMALSQLEKAGIINASQVWESPLSALQAAIRPAGFYRIKAGYLKNTARFWLDSGGQAGLAAQSDEDLQRGLSAVKGLGVESVADILLYGFARPVWVVDAYTRRLIDRLGFPEEARWSYHKLAEFLFKATINPHWTPLQQVEQCAYWHGLIVAHAKRYCRKKPLCRQCPLHASRDLPICPSV